MKSPLRWPGGKGRLAGVILEHMPEHEAFVEACCGGATVFWAKPREMSNAEILNDARNAWRQYEMARSLLADIENDMLKQSRQVLDTMEFSYKRGDAGFVDFLEAQRACNGTIQSHNDAHAEFARSLYLIDATIGR